MAELNFHQLRIFAVVARVGSFSRAARELRISQPAVSSQVRQIEADLGTDLIDRAGRRVGLTDAGRTVAEYAQRIFAISEEMVGALQSLRDLSRGHLAIGACLTLGEYLLPSLLGRYRRTHPGIDLKLEISSTQLVVDQVLHHDVDIGFVADEVKVRGIVVTPFGVDPLLVVAAPSHPLAAVPVTPEALGGLDFVMPPPDSSVRRIADRSLDEFGVHPRVVLELASSEALKQAVAANLGVTVASRLAVAFELEVGRLVELRVEGLAMQRPMNVLVHRDKQATLPERAFLDLVLI